MGPAEHFLGDKLVILIPVYNDWMTVARMLPDLDKTIGDHNLTAELLLVDDGSTMAVPEGFGRYLRAISSVDVLTLKRNLGHQRAIAVGLVYACENMAASVLVVMDGDGEDAPADIPQLIRKSKQEGNSKIVFAERTKRANGLGFKLLYECFKLMHRMLVGDRIRVGNFSLIPYSLLSRVVAVAEIWNHYAAAVIRSRLPYATVPLARSKRLLGNSQMNLPGLVMHGLSAISVYGDITGVRLLIATVVILLVSIGLLIAAVALRATGAWANVTGLLVVILLQTLMMSFLIVFLVLFSRSQSSFLPVRDCPYFVGGVERVFPVSDASHFPVSRSRAESV